MNSEALQSLNIIIDSKLINIGRCSNMVWLWFQKNSSIFVLHLQCPWRIVDDEQICIASGDIYSPSSIFTGDFENFIWDLQGANLFDEYTQTSFVEEEWCVNTIVVTAIGDINIHFSSGKDLQIYIDNSTDEEQWRFFEKGVDNKHLVATAKGILLE